MRKVGISKLVRRKRGHTTIHVSRVRVAERAATSLRLSPGAAWS